ncbi:MAG: 16S rRNA (uracil(1498)-N(3))-methyltransferase [Bacteroidota bacterium]|nr:16S rRNA (uracil(1498)-N(3))-methyltransferase [Bacteroidota bacterium]
MILFFGQRISENLFQLQDDEYHHCFKVTRHRLGDAILVTDFQGVIWNGFIESDSTKTCDIKLASVYKTEHIGDANIVLAISPTQQMERFEWFVEKSVEAGVHEIIPLHCARTENTRIKAVRLEKISLSAAKQTLRPLLPKIHPMVSFNTLVTAADFNQKFICHCEDGTEGFIGKKYNARESVLILIGPAGDFTGEEIQLAKQSGFLAVDLGPQRLRTETAGLAALMILQTIKNL